MKERHKTSSESLKRTKHSSHIDDDETSTDRRQRYSLATAERHRSESSNYATLARRAVNKTSPTGRDQISIELVS